MLPTNKEERKQRPMARGLLDYFPDALAEVSHVSHVGNEQHNPGEKLHWAKHKSTDHADCIMRHMAERETRDSEGLRHTAKIAWRALAMLQIELEEEAKTKGDDNCRDGRYVSEQTVHGSRQYYAPTPKETCFSKPPLWFKGHEAEYFEGIGCSKDVAALLAKGINYCDNPKDLKHVPCVYIAGPMRDLPDFNFPAFDKARDEWVKRGFDVISPADIDRADPATTPTTNQPKFVYRDFMALYGIKMDEHKDSGIVMLDGWSKSTGARAELMLALWLGLRIYVPDGRLSTALSDGSVLNLFSSITNSIRQVNA